MWSKRDCATSSARGGSNEPVATQQRGRCFTTALTAVIRQRARGVVDPRGPRWADPLASTGSVHRFRLAYSVWVLIAGSVGLTPLRRARLRSTQLFDLGADATIDLRAAEWLQLLDDAIGFRKIP